MAWHRLRVGISAGADNGDIITTAGETHDDFLAQYEGYIQNLACNEVSGLDQFLGSEGVMCYT